MADCVENVDDPAIRTTAVEMVSCGEASQSIVPVTDEKKRGNPVAPKVPSPKSSPSMPGSPRTECQTLAQKLAIQAVSKSKPDQWGLLTAVSDKARKRTQGSHIILYGPEHVLGRTVTEISFQFDSPAVSGRHCTLTRRLISADGHVILPGKNDLTSAGGGCYAIFVKDSSSNGTFVNKDRLKKNGAEVRLQHGDILSLVSFPEHENAFAFVFREVLDDSTRQQPKRKNSPADHEVEASGGEGKRIRGTGNGASDGPVCLDDVRRLQKSNEELRQQLEGHVLEIEKMRGEFRAAEALHLVELKDVRASVTELHVHQIEEIRLELVNKTKELEESSALCVQHQTTIEDLNHRLSAAAQSRVDAEEAIQSHKSSIAELKKRLEDESNQRQKERGEWEASLEAAVERTRVEASEELKRHSEVSARLQKQQQDTILDLQEADKVNRLLADSLRGKLEAERQAVIKAEEKSRRLAVHLQEERLSTENACKKAAEFEEELRQLYMELEREKSAKESAGAKVSSLERAMEMAIRDLTLEKQRLQGARERIVLRETQLRAFYSTAAQVEALQQKQQEQLKLMLRTLEDGDGDGDYSQSKNPKHLGQTEVVGNESRTVNGKVVSLAWKQRTSGGDGADLQDKGLLRVHTGRADGENDKDCESDEKLIDDVEGSDQKVGCAEADWMDGDTQQEVDCLAVVSNLPNTVIAPVDRTDAIISVPNGMEEEEDSGTKVVNLNLYDTQMVENGILDATQMVADTLQETKGSDQAENVDCGVGYEGATIEMDNGFQERCALDSVGIGQAGGNEILPSGVGIIQAFPSATPNLHVGDRVTGINQGINEDTQVEGRNDQDTMCTDDLLASEVAGSWALGTPASQHAENDVGSFPNVESKIRGVIHKTRLERRENENTMCTDDLLTSEVAGSWAISTHASGHADNESIRSDERNHTDEKEFQQSVEGVGRLVAGTHPQGSIPRPNLHHILLEEVLHLADPVNSQSSLSPATTNPSRNERKALNEMLDIVEPGFGSLHGLPKVTRDQSDIDDSTTEEDEDENENEEVNASSDGSQPLNLSPSVSVR